MGIVASDGEILPIRVKWRRVIGVCRKCSRKLDNEGYGEQGDLSLKKALRRDGGRYLKVIDIKCLGICPKRGITVIDSERPGEVLVAGQGDEVVARLLALPMELAATIDP
ncbi:putative metal-binding protein [Endobacter medicaginis]|uniref:Putative metal-binding protein n=1 Tax=Endobacter medicaginis TaxID=1181271 RepID=A0A850NXF9_9PROT|nr:hypothetical protein [Endobacter medicaginis]MBB3172929.1 putative metal-binding protein [Endobacter medicaginis]MCX5474854.1 hypothetical protein [Endobacter medicaginis]NVN32132.1 hypothetical protein [Endobacter medicaginis]